MYSQPSNPEITLVTDLTRGECLQLLRGKIGEPRRFAYLNPRNIIGRITDNQIQLEKNFDYRNSWHVRFYGTLYAAKYGTVIEGSLVIPSFVEPGMKFFFAILVFGVVLVTTLQLVAFAQGRWHFDWGLAGGYLIFLISFGFWRGMEMNGKTTQRKQAQELIHFLEETLQAKMSNTHEPNDS